MSNFFVALAVFVITVVGALFAVPYFIDWNGYRGVFEEEATRLLGREVRVGGAVNLHLLPTPYFRFEKVRIADAFVNLEEPFFRADSLTVKLTVPPLFRGAVEANEIEFQRPVLRLAMDDKGSWNWQSFGSALTNAAYLPSNVALTSLRITDGTVALHGTDGAERTSIVGLNAELSSPALDGPYRFRGTFGKGAAEQELRIATARPESDGAVRFKASLRAMDAGTTYTLDGRLLELMGKPRLEGELTARLPIAGLWQKSATARAQAPKAPAGEDASRSEPAFELKSAVKAEAAGAVLSDLALSFEQDGRPQLITGGMKADWRRALAVEMDLSSRWLDLDRIAGAGEGARPLDSIVPFAVRLRDLLPAEGRSRASISVDQANIGGEAISGLRLALVRAGDKLEVQELRLGMPGGSRGELKGIVSGPPDAAVFDGTLGVRGTSLVRFVGWASGSAVPVNAKGDGAFGIRSQLSIAPGRVAARDIIGDLSGTAVYGAAHYRWEGRPELSLRLEGPQLDARAFVPAGASLGSVLDLVLHGPSPSRAQGQAPSQALATRKSGWREGQTDTLIRLNAGELITASRTYRDVAIEIELKGGNLKLPLLRLTGDDGFNLELEGEVNEAAVRPKGNIRAVFSAESPQAIAPLTELLGIPETFRPNERRASALVPLRMAGTMTFGSRSASSTDLTLDGEAKGANVRINARLDGGPGGWRSGPAEITATVEGSDAAMVTALLIPGGGSSRTDSQGPGRILFKAGGVPSEGLTSLATLEAGDIAMNFRGQLVTADRGNKVSGDLEFKSADGSRLAALAGLAPPLNLDGLPISGTLRLAAAGGTLNIDRLALKVAGGEIRGQLALSSLGERRRIEARLGFDELTVAKLFAPLLNQRFAVTAAAEAAVSGRQNPWPDETFDGAVLDGFEGSIRLTAKRLALAEGITLSQASVDVDLGGGKIDVKRIEGAALGGRISATVSIGKVPAGADVSGTLRLEDGALDAWSSDPGGRPHASGSVRATLNFSGKGTSPRNVISALQGGGSIELRDARLSALWPGAVGLGVEAALKVEPDKMPATLKLALASGLSAGQLQIGPKTLEIEIADGQLRAKPFAVDTSDGRASGVASVDLRTLAFDTEWRLERAAAGSTAEKPLPAVTVGYRGPVAALGKLEPRVGAEALERELSVRRMERDVEELERLRRLDEARRRNEAERLRQQLERAPPPAPGPLPVPPTGSGARPATPG